MNDSLVLTFAELGFLLRSQSPTLDLVRLLDLGQDVGAEAVLRSGSASLLARGLCTVDGDEVVPTAELVAVTAGLSLAEQGVRALGEADGQTLLTYLFDGPGGRLAVVAGRYGQYGVRALDPDRTLAEQVARFVDSCLGGGAESAVVIQSVRGGDTVSIAVATDEAGVWHVSDSVGSPDRGVPSTRDAAVARIAELLGSGQAAGVR